MLATSRLILVALCVIVVAAQQTCQPMSGVTAFNPMKYTGKWFEIATTPPIYDFSEKNCTCTSFNHTLVPSPAGGSALLIVASCRKPSVSSPPTFLLGSAVPVSAQEPGWLNMEFFNASGPASTNFTANATSETRSPSSGFNASSEAFNVSAVNAVILAIGHLNQSSADQSYDYALLGEPCRAGLWILSRTPSLPPTLIDQLAAQAKSKGYPSDLGLKLTQQQQCAPAELLLPPSPFVQRPNMTQQSQSTMSQTPAMSAMPQSTSQPSQSTFQPATQPSQPSVSQPSVSQPSVSVSQPSVSQPSVSQPSVSQPSVSQPSTSMPMVTPTTTATQSATGLSQSAAPMETSTMTGATVAPIGTADEQA